MKKSLYTKLILGYLAFAVLSFLTIAFITSRMSYQYNLSCYAEELRETADGLANRCSELYSGYRGDPQDLYLGLTYLSEYSNNQIWVMDNKGKIVFDSAGIRTDLTIQDFDPLDSVSGYQTGRFYGTFAQDMLTVASPITANFTTYGYILMHMPLSHIATVSDGMLWPTYLTFVIIFILSFIILLIFRFNIFLPLKEITTAANEYAAGNLKYELEVSSEDEMGYLARTLNYMAHELSNSEEYQKKFIANVSHDFRSPLTSIRGYLEAIVDGTIPPEQHEKYLNIVINETNRLTGLTQNMLSLNSLDRSSMHLEKTDFDINLVIRDTCATFEGICRSKDIEFNLSFPDFSTMVHADKAKIQQVIYNLVDNAIKFSHDHSAITIEVYEQREKIFVSVKDTGIGIPKEDQKKIWTRFFKSDASRGKDKKGTGLGLSIVKEIISAHDETIDVISTEGVGTEFIFRLPKGL